MLYYATPEQSGVLQISFYGICRNTIPILSLFLVVVQFFSVNNHQQ